VFAIGAICPKYAPVRQHDILKKGAFFMAKRFAFYSLNFANDVKAFSMIPFKSVVLLMGVRKGEGLALADPRF